MHKMTMEEKKKAEKFILEEIDSSEGKYKKSRDAKRGMLTSELEGNIPKTVSAIHDQLLKANETAKKCEERLKELGYEPRGYDNLRLDVHYDHPQLKEFDEATEQERETLKQLRRTFVVKIYSETGGIEEVLSALKADLAKIKA